MLKYKIEKTIIQKNPKEKITIKILRIKFKNKIRG
jgi:hypothetical protein